MKSLLKRRWDRLVEFMIFAHFIIGLMLGKFFGYPWFWFLGSVVADIDHLFVLIENKIFSWNKFVDSLRFEEKYGIRYKTKYLHSIFGAVIVSAPVFLIDIRGGLYFFVAYLTHLLIDWFDVDRKQYLYPFKKEFWGFLPIFSWQEIIFTIFLLIIYFTVKTT